jgi:CRP-like cAMP-binding protein
VQSSSITQQHESPLEPMVGKLAYRGKLDAADRAALLALPHVVKSFQSNHYVVREREEPSHCCLMLSGYSIRHKIVAGGFRQIVAIHMKGELVDLQNSLLGVADHSVQMLTAGQVVMIPREEIVRIAFERPEVGKALWTDSLVDGSIFREWIANVGRRDAYTRIAHVLCEFGLRLQHAGLGQENAYDLPMTQEQLADATGLTSVHVNRVIKKLESEGLISRTSPRSVTIGDWKRLAETGDFDSGYLHMKKSDPMLA